MKFDEVIEENVRVRCRTEEQAKKYLFACNKKGLVWGNGEKLTNLTRWDNYNNKTYYRTWNNKKMYYGTIDNNPDYIDFTDIDEFSPHELTAMEFLEKYSRVCKSYKTCTGCPLSRHNNKFNRSCHTLCKSHPAEAIRIISEWEEPKQVKTIMDDFLEKYPKAFINHLGVPPFCPELLGYIEVGKCPIKDDEVECREGKCWHTPLSETEGTK